MQLYEIIADIYAIISYNGRHLCNYVVYLPFSAIKWNERNFSLNDSNYMK